MIRIPVPTKWLLLDAEASFMTVPWSGGEKRGEKERGREIQSPATGTIDKKNGLSAGTQRVIAFSLSQHSFFDRNTSTTEPNQETAENSRVVGPDTKKTAPLLCTPHRSTWQELITLL
jgi:hypothetical protein